MTMRITKAFNKNVPALMGFNRRKAPLRERLKEGAKARARRDIGMSKEWFSVEKELLPD